MKEKEGMGVFRKHTILTLCVLSKVINRIRLNLAPHKEKLL